MTSNDDKEILSVALSLAYERLNTGIDEAKLVKTHKFISSMFPDATLNDITTALKNGASGLYGRTYRMSDQELCIWIRQYLEETESTRYRDIVCRYTEFPNKEWKTIEDYYKWENNLKHSYKKRDVKTPYLEYLEKTISKKLGL